ncbi:hypothetical protein COAQ111491_22100 [Comamonas aquatilis]
MPFAFTQIRETVLGGDQHKVTLLDQYDRLLSRSQHTLGN